MHGDSRSVEVPHGALSAEALRGVIEEFVTRAGTDYGTQERTIEEKITDVTRQLERGEVVIVLDAETATTNIIAAGACAPPRRPGS
jgi:uncharacterized protein